MRTLVFNVKQTFKDIGQLYVFIIILVGLTLQKLFENNPDNWMIISIIPSKTSDVYDIEWSLNK